MTIDTLKELALHSVKGTAPTEYTVENVNAALVDGLNELAGSVNQFMKNRYDIYEIIIAAVDEIQPKKVLNAIGAFAEVQAVAQGEHAVFKTKKGRNRARKFFTQVGLSGVYDTFRLDQESWELSAHAVGGGATVDFERLLDGAETLSDVADIMTEGLTDAVFVEVAKALNAAISNSKMPARNKATDSSFVASKMVKVMNTVRAYGNNVVIFAYPEFIAEMGVDQIVSGANYQPIVHPDDIEKIHTTGFITMFRGAPLVQIPNSFTDENNDQYWFDPQYAYILPTGNERVVKVVLEGNTQMYDHINKDNSIEIYGYKKIGVGILHYNNWGIYQNTSLASEAGMKPPYVQ